jgi:hypothetical protein
VALYPERVASSPEGNPKSETRNPKSEKAKYTKHAKGEGVKKSDDKLFQWLLL